MTINTIRKSIFLNFTSDQVWHWLTAPEKLGQWFHKPRAALTAGAPTEMFGTTSGDKLMRGTVKTARPPAYLEYTFTINPMGDAVSLVK